MDGGDVAGELPAADAGPPPAWHPDPSGRHRLRWWDGDQWTAWVADGGQPTIDPPVATGGDDGRIPLPTSALRSAFLGFLAAFAAGFAGAIVVAVVMGLAFESDWFPPIIVGSLAGTWSVLFKTAQRVSRRHGTGQVFRDFGFRVEPFDLARGLALLVAAYGLAMVVIGFIASNPDLQGTNTGDLVEQKDNVAGILILGAVTIVGAPIFEELFFRGLVQRALVPRFGEVGASLLQAVAFGLVHFQPGAGLGNVSIVLVTGCLGAALGQGVRIWRRLGPAIVAHAMFNTVAVVLTLATA